MTDITWSLLIQVVSFLIFFLIFRRVFFAPIMETLQHRESEITSLLEEAEDRRERAVEMEEKCAARLRDARDEADRIIREGEQKAREIYDDVLSAARRESDSLLSDAREEIDQERQRALANFESEAVGLASDIAARVLQRRLSSSENEELRAEVMEAVREKSN